MPWDIFSAPTILRKYVVSLAVNEGMVAHVAECMPGE